MARKERRWTKRVRKAANVCQGLKDDYFKDTTEIKDKNDYDNQSNQHGK